MNAFSRPEQILKDYNKLNTGKPDIYINEDLTQLRANLAKKARDCKKAKKIRRHMEHIWKDICKGPS